MNQINPTSFFPQGIPSFGSIGAIASVPQQTQQLGGYMPSLPVDMASISNFRGDAFNGGFGNPFGSQLTNFSNMGFGSVPGFGGALDPTGSMFGGLMQQMQSQQQMMTMMIMMMMMMMQQKNGFAGNQQGNNPAGTPANGAIPSGGGGGGSAPVSGGGGSAPASGGGGAAPASGGGGAAPASGGGAATGASGAQEAGSTGGGGGDKAAETAKKFLGQESYKIKGKLPHFTAAGGQTNNCADFVSSCLEGAGMIQGHHINVKEMEQSLKKQGWKQVPVSQSKPGDVWMNDSRGHVELVVGKGNGELIGSNNDRPGHQVISKGQAKGGVIYQKA